MVNNVIPQTMCIGQIIDWRFVSGTEKRQIQHNWSIIFSQSTQIWQIITFENLLTIRSSLQKNIHIVEKHKWFLWLISLTIKN